jgi:hypothetical protein
VDSTRFPNGLKPLSDYAHALGMKFGIWVEPERVNLATVGAPGADESWLATSGGNYGSDDAAQICLATAAGRQWVLDQLTALIDAVQPDYVKWDNNMWINCDRPGHGHGSTDGNFAHVTGLYQVLAALRQRYPDLLIENVSGGGNRLDFGMVRYSDVAWMDDRTAPSVHVRHNLEGLATAFPPAYLLSFVTSAVPATHVRRFARGRSRAGHAVPLSPAVSRRRGAAAKSATRPLATLGYAGGCIAGGDRQRPGVGRAPGDRSAASRSPSRLSSDDGAGPSTSDPSRSNRTRPAIESVMGRAALPPGSTDGE